MNLYKEQKEQKEHLPIEFKNDKINFESNLCDINKLLSTKLAQKKLEVFEDIEIKIV